MYDKLNIDDNECDDAIDATGYTANFHRNFPKDRYDK